MDDWDLLVEGEDSPEVVARSPPPVIPSATTWRVVPTYVACTPNNNVIVRRKRSKRSWPEGWECVPLLKIVVSHDKIR